VLDEERIRATTKLEIGLFHGHDASG
jgi:hypothetical protein